MMSLKIKKAEAVWEAEQIWKRYGFSSPEDIVLEDLAFSMGILVLEGRLDGAEARLIRDNDQGLIRVKDDIPEQGRKRFAISHELGHWILHKYISQIFSCTSEDMVKVYKASFYEIEANCFAAELLMPEILLKPKIFNNHLSIDAVRELATTCDTTFTASAIRYIDLSKDYCALVVSKGGKISWWRCSDAWENRFWLEVGSPLSKNTIAGGLINGESISSTPQEISLDAWIDNADEFTSDVIIEQAFVMERYGQIISLLRFP